MTSVLLHTPSWRRLKYIFQCPKSWSLLRCLEYERLSKLKLTGRVLDFGGGRQANYIDLVLEWGDPVSGFVYESVNIDPKMEPTFLLAEGDTIPCETACYDHVISLNTFEHIYALGLTFSEIGRVLRPGGRLSFTVPFIFRVHGHPDDFLRGTPSFWNRLLAESGFAEIRIEALTWGPFSTALFVSGCPGPLKRLRYYRALFSDLVYAGYRYELGVEISGKQSAPIMASPIGYFVTARTCTRNRN